MARQASYAYINTTSNDFLGRTWQVLNHTTSTAAGKLGPQSYSP